MLKAMIDQWNKGLEMMEEAESELQGAEVTINGKACMIIDVNFKSEVALVHVNSKDEAEWMTFEEILKKKDVVSSDVELKYPSYFCKDCAYSFYDEVGINVEPSYTLECDECGELAELTGYKDEITADDKKWNGGYF